MGSPERVGIILRRLGWWEADVTELASRVPDHLRGDGPCADCGTVDNIVWFTESPLWNEVMGGPGTLDDPGGIVCVPCFIVRTDAAGLCPTGWRLIPEWHWETHEEREARRTGQEC